MIFSTRFALFRCCAAALAGGVTHAQTNVANASVAPASPAMATMLAALPKWTGLVAVETSYGYKDNLLLSAIDRERSAFARGGVEALLLYVPPGRLDFSVYAQADRTHFFEGEAIDHEAQAWVSTDLGYRPNDAWRFSLPITGYYADRALDNSDTDFERVVAQLKEAGGTVSPTVRWKFHPVWWIEAQALGQRRFYQERAFATRIGEGSLRLGWKVRPRIEARISATQRWKDYVDRAQYSAVGRELVGTQLKITEREAELRLDYTWDESERWQTSTRFRGAHYRDNGSGYFSYREQMAGQDLEWKGEAWKVRVGASARRIDYNVQTVGFGIDPAARLRDEFSAEVQIERRLTARWTALAEYRWERSRSNDRFASYVVNEGLLGLRWSWEK